MIELIGIFLAIISFVPLSLDAQLLTKGADPMLTRGAGEDDLRILSFKGYLKESEYKNHETPYHEFSPKESHKVKNDDDDGNHRWEEKLKQVETGKESKKKSGEHIKWEDEDLKKTNGKSEMRSFNTTVNRPRRSLAEFQRSEKLGSQSESGSEAGKPRSKRSWYEFFIHPSNPTTRGSPAMEFSYENTEEWSITNPACSGRLQSPINIDTEKLIGLALPSNLIWAGYWQQPETLLISNTGNTVLLEGCWNDVTPFITGGPLTGEYQFVQLHFHWDLLDFLGSEHTINNKRFPMEMHMVHYKRDYGSFENAIKYHDGVALVAFFFEVCDTPNLGLDLLMDGLLRVENNPGVNETIQPFPLDILPATFDRNYITYKGSLPTPPCHEVATWLLSTNLLPISRTQLDRFREISIRWAVQRNSRPRQAVNGRPLYYVN